jgi:hypothetical protein
MAKKGLGIYPKADAGWSSHLSDIFKKSGFTAGNYGIATVSLVSREKDATTLKNNPMKLDRLRYQLHTDKKVKDTTDVKSLIKAGDQVDVVWVGHGGYMSDHNNFSTKFAPHHGTNGANAYMSAKELARIIHTVCVTSDNAPVYPTSLTIISCYAGNARVGQWREAGRVNDRKVSALMNVSKSDDPLAFKVLIHLYSMFDPPPPHKCTVAGPQRDLMGSEIRGLAIPPTATDWSIGEL